MNITRHLVVALLAAAPLIGAAEGDPLAAHRYGAVSLVGDRLTVVTHEPAVGSSLDTNAREDVPVASSEFDDAALRAIQRGFASRSLAAPVLYRFHVGANDAPVVDGENVHLPDELAKGLARDGVTDLVLVTPMRAPTRLRERAGHVGSGFLEGLGFYVDSSRRTRRGDTGERGHGFLAPYVYVQVSLVDVATRRVVRREAVVRGDVYSAARNVDGSDAWGALTPTGKVRIIRNLLGREVYRSTLELTGA